MSERRRYPPDASEARGTGGGGRRGAQGRGREAAEPPTHTASPMGLRNCIGGEEVAATFRDTEDFSPRALCLCRYAPPDTYSPFFFLPAFICPSKKNVGTKRRPQDVRFTELLIGGKKKNRSVVRKIIQRCENQRMCEKEIPPTVSFRRESHNKRDLHYAKYA